MGALGDRNRQECEKLLTEGKNGYEQDDLTIKNLGKAITVRFPS